MFPQEPACVKERQASNLCSILLLAGAFAFAFLLGEMVHEFGHYFGHRAFGSPGVSVYLDPFGGSHIVGANGLPNAVLAWTALTGPLFNLWFGLSLSLLLAGRRGALWLPLKLCGPVALIQEGVTFSLGSLTPGGDARWIATLGIPLWLIVLAGCLCLLAGVIGVSRLLPRFGVGLRIASWTRFGIVLAGMGAFMALRALVAVTRSPQAALENLVPLVFALLLAGFVVLLQKPVAQIWPSRELAQTLPISPVAAFTVLMAGGALLVFQILVFNMM